MRVGLLGLSQSGKRTLFTLLTGRRIPPGHREEDSLDGTAPVRDPRVDVLASLMRPERKRYAETHIVLCPPVVSGAGERAWMEEAKGCDLLCMVLRAFASDQVYHPAGSVDAARDRSSLETELMIADLSLAEKRLERLAKEKRGGQTPAQAMEEKVLMKCKEALEAGRPLREADLAEHERKAVASLDFLTLRPVIWAYNVDENHIRDPGASTVPGDGFVVSCLIEREIMDLPSEEERGEYMRSVGLTASGIDRLNQAAYEALGLMSFYTIGKDEVRAWTIRKGAKAPEAAGKIHSDIERGFIRVEVVKYDDLVALGSEEAVRRAGKEQVKGRDYVIEDGDICHFRFSV